MEPNRLPTHLTDGNETRSEVIGMKKWICLTLALMIIGCSALAGTPQFSDSLFSSAKQAVSYLASGEYERLVTLLPFSGVAPSAAEWESFAASFSDLSNVQQDYAVAFWTGSVWVVAVPIQTPDDGSVEGLALSSEDGSTFNGYRYCTWSQIESAYGKSDHVLWNNEYVDGTPTVVTD